MDIYGAKRAPVSEKISTNFLNESFYMSSTVQTNTNPVSHFDMLESLLKTNGHVKSSNTITSVDFFEAPEDTLSQKKSPENILIPELEISYDEYDEDDDDDEDDNGQFSMNLLNIQPLKERMQRKGSKVHIMNRSFSNPRSKEPLYVTNASENSDQVSAAHGLNNATAVKSLRKGQENSALNQSFYSDFVKMNASSDSADVQNNSNINNNNNNNNNNTGNNNNEINDDATIKNTTNINNNSTTAAITPINISQPPASTKSVLSSATGPKSTGKSLQKKKSVSLMLPERDRDIWGNCAVASGNLPVIYSNNTNFNEAGVDKPMVDTNTVPNNTNYNISKSPAEPLLMTVLPTTPETTPGTAVSTQPKTMARTLSRILSEMSMDGDVADECDDSSDDDSQSFAEVNRKLNSFKTHRNSNNTNNTDHNTTNNNNNNNYSANNIDNNVNKTTNDLTSETVLSVAAVGSKSNDDGDFCDDFDAVPVRSLVRRTSASFYDNSPTNKLKHVNSFSSNSSNNTGNTGNNSGNNTGNNSGNNTGNNSGNNTGNTVNNTGNNSGNNSSNNSGNNSGFSGNNSGMHRNNTFNSENIGYTNILTVDNTVVVLPSTHKQPPAPLSQHQTPQLMQQLAQQEPLQNTTNSIAQPSLSTYKESFENIHFDVVFENSKCDTVENHVNPMFGGRNSNRNSLSSHSVSTAVSNNTKNTTNSNNSNANNKNNSSFSNININSNNNSNNNDNSVIRNIPAAVVTNNNHNDTNIESEIDLILTRTQSTIEQSIQQSRLSMRGLSNKNDNNNSKRVYHIDTSFGDSDMTNNGGQKNSTNSQYYAPNINSNTNIAQNLTLLQPQTLQRENNHHMQQQQQQQYQQQEEQFAVRNAMQFISQINSPSHTKSNTNTTPCTTTTNTVTPNNVTPNNVTPNSGLKRTSTQYQIIRQKPEIQHNNNSNNSKSMNNLYASPQQYTPTRSVVLRPGEYADHNRPRDHNRPQSAVTTPITAVSNGVTLHTFLDMGLSRDEAQQLFNEHLAVLRNSNNNNNYIGNSNNNNNNNNSVNNSNISNNQRISSSSNNNTPIRENDYVFHNNSNIATNSNSSSNLNSNTNHSNSFYNNNDNVVRSRAGLSPFNRSHSTPVMTSPAAVVTPYITTSTISPHNSVQLKSSLKTSPKSSPKHGSNSGPMTPYFGPNFGSNVDVRTPNNDGNVNCQQREDDEDLQRAILLSQQEALYGHSSNNSAGGLVRTNSVRFA